VRDNTQALAATVVGAVIGGLAGYFFFTERGRALRRQFEPAVEDIARELISFRTTVEKAGGVAKEGWKLLNDVLAEGENSARYSTTRQSSPF